MTEIVELHRRGAERFTQAVDAIGNEDWHRPTPCTEWDVTTLLDHNVGENLWVPPILEGQTIEEVGDRFEGDVLGDDPKGAWKSSADAACAAAEGLDDVQRVVHLSFGDLPAEEYLWQRYADFVVHGWDLARGVGADDRLGDDLVEPCLRWAEPYAEIFASMPDYFAPPITPAPEDDAQARLLKLFGRDPARAV